MKIINKENLYKIFPFIQLWENNKKLQKDLDSLEKNNLKINFNDVDNLICSCMVIQFFS